MMGGLRGGVEGLKTLLSSIAHAQIGGSSPAAEQNPGAGRIQAGDGRPDHLPRGGPGSFNSQHGAGVLSLLEVLNDDQREVLLLRVIADLPLDQVAAIMAKSVGAVKQLQRRALAVLKEQRDVKERRGR